MPEHPHPASPPPLPPFQSGDLGRFLSATRLAPRQSHKALTVWPLLTRASSEPESPHPAALVPPYIALADAMAAGTLQVQEVSEHGAVPHVVAENHGDTAVLVLFGEQLVGAKQNRIANASFLVAAGSRVVLDVSCVEQGRWAPRSSRFRGSGEVFSSRSRSRMAERVSRSREEGRGFDADQGAVWGDVSDSLRRSGTHSPTESYEDHLQTHAGELAEASDSFHPLAEQVGFVASIGDAVAGLEVVGRPEVFARTFQALLRAYLVDALDPAGEPVGPSHFDAPDPFLSAVASASTSQGPSLGLGEDVRLASRRIAGCALFAGGLVHLTAFPASHGARWKEAR